MDEKLFNWIEEFIEAKIAYEMALRDSKEAYACGAKYEEEQYRLLAVKKEKEVNKLRKDIVALIGCVNHCHSISK